MKKLLIILLTFLCAFSAKAQVASTQSGNSIVINNQVTPNGMTQEQWNFHLNEQQIKLTQQIKIDKAFLISGLALTGVGVVTDVVGTIYTSGFQSEMNDIGGTIVYSGVAITTVGILTTGISAICLRSHKDKLNRITLARSGVGINVLF